MAGVLTILFFVLVVSAVALVLVAKNLIFIAGPNEALVFSGRETGAAAKRPRGYRVIRGGRGIRTPFLEVVDRIDLTNMIIEVSVTNAYSKGGIPLKVQGVANLKIASHEPALSNAIERFLTMDRKEVVRIAKDTLEGNLRGVLSQLTPEEVNNDKITFAEKLLEEAEIDLGKLGLVLDTLKIQNVSDDVQYLDSIGRRQSAEVVKRARIAEAESRAVSLTREAENQQRARLAAIEAEKRVLQAETQRRIKDAQTRKSAMVAEEVGRVKAAIARARADVDVQQARVERARRQLQADVIAPADADMQRLQAEAKGNASKILEDGKATVIVLEEMIDTWGKGGENARDIFLMQKLQSVMGSLVGTIDNVRIDKITVLPNGQNDGTASKAVRLVEELKGALGMDLPKLLESAAGQKAPPAKSGR